MPEFLLKHLPGPDLAAQIVDESDQSPGQCRVGQDMGARQFPQGVHDVAWLVRQFDDQIQQVKKFAFHLSLQGPLRDTNPSNR